MYYSPRGSPVSYSVLVAFLSCSFRHRHWPVFRLPLGPLPPLSSLLPRYLLSPSKCPSFPSGRGTFRNIIWDFSSVPNKCLKTDLGVRKQICDGFRPKFWYITYFIIYENTLSKSRSQKANLRGLRPETVHHLHYSILGLIFPPCPYASYSLPPEFLLFPQVLSIISLLYFLWNHFPFWCCLFSLQLRCSFLYASLRAALGCFHLPPIIACPRFLLKPTNVTTHTLLHPWILT